MARSCHDDIDIPPHTLMERRSGDHRLGRCLSVTSAPPLLPRTPFDPRTSTSFPLPNLLLTIGDPPGPYPWHGHMEADQRRPRRTRGRPARCAHHPHSRKPRFCKYHSPERASAPSGAVRYTQASSFGHPIAWTGKCARVPHGRHGEYRRKCHSDLFGTARELKGAWCRFIFRSSEGRPETALAKGWNYGPAW